MKIKHLAVALMAAVVALAGWSCNEEPEVQAPVEKPTIGIMEPEFDAEAMEMSVMIAPSTDATAWYWSVEPQTRTEDSPYVKEEGAAAKEIKYAVEYGVEYLISAYAENEAGSSEVATKKFCAMPEGEIAVAIGDIALDIKSMTATATIYPTKDTKVWYWGVAEAEVEDIEWTTVEGNKEQEVSFPYVWGKTLVLHAYAECDAIVGDVVTKECSFKPSVPTIAVSKPNFDEAAMKVSFDVTPSEDTDHWYYGIYDDAEDAKYTVVKDNKAQTVSFDVEYNKDYKFIFRAENALNEGEEKFGEFYVIGSVADIAIENLTAYSLDAVITKKEHCVRYVAGIVHTSAYDRNIFVEQAQTSLNPDPSYPFAIFNSATESRTFSEQDLVRNSRTDSNENAGIILLPKTSYTIAVYGEDAKGNYTVTTKEVLVPEVELNGTTAINVEVSNVDLTSADAIVTTEVGAKVLTGYIDPALAKADTEKPFDFEGKSEAEVKAYIASGVKGVPTVYAEPFTYNLSQLFANDTEYVAYAIAIKDGKVGEVAYTTFRTLRPSLSGVAKVTAAEIEPQTSHETLTVKLTVDENATKVRLYAAPASDHSAYADNLTFIMDAKEYQNYREEYDIVDGVATCVVNIYHPTANYYMYASAVDANGYAGEMVCVATLAGLETEYVTTIAEVIEEGSLSYKGTGNATLTGKVIEVVQGEELRVHISLTATNFSDNVDKAWFIRFNGKTDDVEAQVKEALSEYTETKRVIGSYKIAKEDWEVKYVDGGSDWDPKYEALQSYDASWGGDIIVMVILDTDGKVKIDSYCYYDTALQIVEF